MFWLICAVAFVGWLAGMASMWFLVKKKIVVIK